MQQLSLRETEFRLRAWGLNRISGFELRVSQDTPHPSVRTPREDRRAAILDAVEEKRISTHKASELLAETRQDKENEEERA